MDALPTPNIWVTLVCKVIKHSLIFLHFFETSYVECFSRFVQTKLLHQTSNVFIFTCDGKLYILEILSNGCHFASPELGGCKLKQINDKEYSTSSLFYLFIWCTVCLKMHKTWAGFHFKDLHSVLILTSVDHSLKVSQCCSLYYN